MFLRNRHTDEHCDDGDIKAGITGLSQLGEWEGGKMCFRELCLALPGYAVSGNAFLFRGSVLKHAVAPWSGRRTAFDFTTHESVKLMANRIRADTGTPPSKGISEKDHESIDRARTEKIIIASRLPQKRLFHPGSSSFTKMKHRGVGRTGKHY